MHFKQFVNNLLDEVFLRQDAFSTHKKGLRNEPEPLFYVIFCVSLRCPRPHR